MRVTLRGHSDDMIEIEGDITEDFQLGDPSGNNFLGFSDGTLLRVVYDNGLCHIFVVRSGSAALHKKEVEEGSDDDNDSDQVTLTGDITWVLLGYNWAK